MARDVEYCIRTPSGGEWLKDGFFKVLSAALTGKLRRGLRAAHGDAGPGSWRRRNLRAGDQFAQKVGTMWINPLKPNASPLSRRKIWPSTRPAQFRARIRMIMGMANMAISLGIPPRTRGWDRLQILPPLGGKRFRDRRPGVCGQKSYLVLGRGLFRDNHC